MPCSSVEYSKYMIQVETGQPDMSVRVPLLDTAQAILLGGDPRDQALAHSISAARQLHGGGDILHTVSAPFIGANHETLLFLASGQFNRRPTRENLSELGQAFWTHYRDLMDTFPIVVSEAPWTDEEIRNFRRANGLDRKLALFVPEVVADINNLPLLGKGFPEMNCWVLQPGAQDIKNVERILGWGLTEASLESPHRKNSKGELTGLTEAEARKLIEEAKGSLSGLNYNGYFIASRVSEHLTGSNLDVYTESRLLGSLYYGEVPGVYFLKDGEAYVRDCWYPEHRGPGMGVRFWGANP